jgi:hypothetical protein
MRTAVLRGPALARTALASTIAAGLLTLTGPAALAAPAAHRAPSPVVIREIFYNSPGSDNRSNASLNAEWVKLRNRTAHPVSLSGWTLRDTSRHVYHFAVGYSLRAHGTVRVHTGSGRDTQRNLFQDRRAYVWNNDGDTAILRGPAGNVRDRCSYSDRSERFASVDC